jgi:phosphoglycolate phosphatase
MNIIFDLDGTLVNSAPGVLGALRYVMKKHQIDSPTILSADLIGPPLREMLVSLSGSSTDVDLGLMEQTFKAYYDDAGVFESTIYEGVTQMLDDLKADGHKLFIATNKRTTPTRSLMKHFSWEKYFLGIYSLDSSTFPVKDKAALLDCIVNMHSLLKDETIYIGDRPEDRDSARKCNLKFMHATWGYGGDIGNSLGLILRIPNEIVVHLK